MAEHTLTPKGYTGVLVVLLVLTVVTVGFSFVPLGPDWHVGVGLVIGTCKATLVVLFFMHALHSNKLTWLAIGAGLFWLSILLVLTLSDYLARGLLPYPGH
jgi:cytochrome c oxidase subunit 4